MSWPGSGKAYAALPASRGKRTRSDPLSQVERDRYQKMVGQRIGVNVVGKLVFVGASSIIVEIEEWDGNTVRVHIAPLRALLSPTGETDTSTADGATEGVSR